MTDVFFETSTNLVNQWNKLVEGSGAQETEIEVTNWAGRFAYGLHALRLVLLLTTYSWFGSLDTIGRAAFSYDFDCLSGEPHELASALDGLTNNAHTPSSFYMRALFWIFPAILFIGKKGEMIKQVKYHLGSIASEMLNEAKRVGDQDSRTLMAHICLSTFQFSIPVQHSS